MTTTIFKSLFLSAILAIGISSCSESKEDKVADAQENVDKAQQKLDQANLDLDKEHQAFKADMETKLRTNDSLINIMRIKMATESKTSREIHEKQIDAIALKNEELRRSINEYKETNVEDEATFKSKFNRDMNELHDSIKNLFK